MHPIQQKYFRLIEPKHEKKKAFQSSPLYLPSTLSTLLNLTRIKPFFHGLQISPIPL